MDYKTGQEKFLNGQFGDEYIGRNNSDEFLASNISFFSKIFRRIQKPNSLIEFGANIGMNLKAIKSLYPSIDLYGIEINEKASDELSTFIGKKMFLKDLYLIINPK